MELNQQQIQFAIKDINQVFTPEPKLRVIGPKEMLRGQIVDAITKATSANDPRLATLAGETIDVYNAMIDQNTQPAPDPPQEPSTVEAAQPGTEQGTEPQQSQESAAAAAGEEDDCFGVSYDANATECQPNSCGRAAECAAKMSGKAPPKVAGAGKVQKTKKPAAEKYTRAHAFCDALKAGSFDSKALAVKLDELYAAKGHASNIKESTWAVGNFLKPLLILGIVKEEGGMYTLSI